MTLPLIFASAVAAEGDWTIGSRTLPAPAAGSEALRISISSTPAPNVAMAIATFGAGVDEMEILSASLPAAGAGKVREPIVQSPSAATALAKISGSVIIETNING